MPSRGYPPICAECRHEMRPRKTGRGGWQRSGEKCATCARRQRRAEARNPRPVAPAPRTLKASDSGYGAFGVARLDVAS